MSVFKNKNPKRFLVGAVLIGYCGSVISLNNYTIFGELFM